MSLTSKFQRGWFTIDAVQLTEENLWAVYEWADSKPFFGPKANDADAGHPITGLTVFESTGRHRANWGDWIYRTPAGGFGARTDAEFREFFTPIGGE